jgi:hypothetical protein
MLTQSNAAQMMLKQSTWTDRTFDLLVFVVCVSVVIVALVYCALSTVTVVESLLGPSSPHPMIRPPTILRETGPLPAHRHRRHGVRGPYGFR